MKNRFLVLLITVSVLFSTFSFAYAEGSSQTVVDYESAKFLDSLGIMQLLENDEYSQYMTREDFAYSVAMLMGLTGTTNTRYYTDLRAESFAFAHINNLAEAGVLAPAVNATFRPLDYITFNEAYKMLVVALGYAPMAELKGGYPVGYSSVARYIGIGDSGNSGNVTWAVAVDMFYEALKTAPYDISAVNHDGATYAVSDECYANRRYNLKYSVGTVRATHYGNIDDTVVLEEKSIKINNTVYTAGESIDERNILGLYGEFFYTDVSGKAEVVYIKDLAKAEDIVIDVELFKGYNNKTIEYYRSEDASRLASVQLSGNTIIYNGLPLRSKIRETLAALNKGTITLKDIDNDRIYDIMDIKDYRNFYVKFVDGTKLYNELVFDDYIDLKNGESISVKKNGSYVTDSEVTAKLSLSVAVSIDESVIDIIINDTKTAVYTASLGDKIKIDNQSYELDKSYSKTFLKETQVGNTYKFWIDFMGKVSYVEPEKERRMTLGYIINAVVKDENFDQNLFISFIAADGGKIIAECAENIVIDAVKYRKKTAQEILNVLKNGKAHARQIIQYAMDKNGKISEIDTVVKNPGEDPEYSLRPVFSEVKSRWYHLGRYGFTAICTNDTVAFCIPNNGSTDEKKYYVGKGAKTITKSDDCNATLDCYYVSENSPYVDAVIGEMNIDDYVPRSVLMFEEGVQSLNEDGDMVYKISGYTMGAAQEFVINENVIGAENITSFNCGDLIVLQENQTGEVNVIEKVFDAKTKSPINWEYETDKELLYVDGFKEHYCEELNLSFGYVRKNYGGVISISKTATADISERIHTNKRLNMLYDSKTETIELVTDDRIVDYETAGETCMRAVHHMWYEDGRGVYLYN